MVTPGWFLRMCLDSRVGEKGWQRDERKQGRMEKKKKRQRREIVQRGGGWGWGGVGEMFEAPLQLLPPHFVAWRHLEEMQMRRWKERRLRVPQTQLPRQARASARLNSRL